VSVQGYQGVARRELRKVNGMPPESNLRDDRCIRPFTRLRKVANVFVRRLLGVEIVVRVGSPT